MVEEINSASLTFSKTKGTEDPVSSLGKEIQFASRCLRLTPNDVLPLALSSCQDTKQPLVFPTMDRPERRSFAGQGIRSAKAGKRNGFEWIRRTRRGCGERLLQIFLGKKVRHANLGEPERRDVHHHASFWAAFGIYFQAKEVSAPVYFNLCSHWSVDCMPTILSHQALMPTFS